MNAKDNSYAKHLTNSNRGHCPNTAKVMTSLRLKEASGPGRMSGEEPNKHWRREYERFEFWRRGQKMAV